MRTKDADLDTIVGRIIRRSKAIEKLLRKHYKLPRRGLYKAIDDLSDTLPAILARTIRVVAKVRNEAAHHDEFEPAKVPPDFDRLCDEIELLIPYFASQQLARPAQPLKDPKPPAPKPKATVATPKPQSNGVAANVPANHSKLWTPEEDKKLTDAFDAQTTISELAAALQRGVGGIRNRLTKLGKLTADQNKAYPPEAQ